MRNPQGKPGQTPLGEMWPCGCVRGGGDGKPSTHIRLNAPEVEQCEDCGATRDGRMLREPYEPTIRTREGHLDEARRIRAGIAQMFIDADYWNTHVREPHEEPVDPDPYGEMRALMAAIDDMLANDPGYGPIAPIKLERRH